MVVKFEVAKTSEDFKALYRLRYDAYCEVMRCLDPKLYPDKEERDKFDEFSIHIVARNDKGEIVGTIRLIKDGPLGFLMEESFILPASLDRARTMEHSRSVVRPDWRGRGIHTLLTEAAYAWQRANSYHICIGAAVKQVADSLLRKGWQPMGPPKIYHEAPATPIIFYLR